MTRVILNGCNGHMGRVLTDIISKDPEIEVACGIDPYTGVQNDYPVFTDIASCDVEADVVIDFSNAKAVDALLDYCEKVNLPVVLCTTGLSDEQLARVDETSKKIAILRSANMSLGVNTILDLLKKATEVFAPAGFDVEIVEKHHNQKT